MTSKTVRQFSAAGPCLTLGALVRETEQFYVYTPNHGRERRVGKGAVHIEPCSSCRDHPRTQYPHGYMD
jgi:hypothetical protein